MSKQEMPEDLKWIAEHVSEWPENYLSVDLVINDSVRPYGKCCNYFESRTEGKYAQPEWLQARRELRLVTTEKEDEAWEAMQPKRSKYHVEINPGVWVDVYDVLTAYTVTNPADAHAIKKMLCPGKRGAKSANQDRREAIQSLERAIELESNDDR